MIEFKQNHIQHAATYDHVWLMARHRYHSRRKKGLRPGDIVIDPSHGIEQMVEMLAAIMGHYIYIPIADHGLDWIAQNSRPHSEQGSTRYVIATRDHLGSLIWETCFAGIAPIDSFQIGLRTSGSESKDGRWVFHSADNIMHQLQHHHQFIDKIQAGEDRVISLPHFHAFGLILDRLLGVYGRQNLIFCSEMRTIIDLLSSDNDAIMPRFAAIVPRQISILYELLRQRQKLDIMRTLTLHTGGAPVSASLQAKLEHICEELIIGYGLTECGPGVLINGKAVGCEVRLSPNHQSNKLFDLEVKTPSLGLMAEDQIELKDGFLLTKDLCIKHPHGIEVIGRQSELIKTQAGEWLHLHDLRSQIGRLLATESFSIQLDYQTRQSHLTIRLLKADKSAPMNRFHSLQHLINKQLGIDVKLWLPTDFKSLTKAIYERSDAMKGKSIDQVLANLPSDYFTCVA